MEKRAVRISKYERVVIVLLGFLTFSWMVFGAKGPKAKAEMSEGLRSFGIMSASSGPSSSTQPSRTSLWEWAIGR